MPENIRFVFPEDVSYEATKALITDKYFLRFNANILKDSQCFVVVEYGEPALVPVACAAVTDAASSPLFSETYLDRPADVMLAEVLGKTIRREELVEVGSLAGNTRPGAVARLLTALPWLLWCRRRRYALVTATAQVRGLLARCRIPFEPLAKARIDVLPPAERSRWGSYYENDPVTGFVNLAEPAFTFVQNGLNAFMMTNVVLTAQTLHSAPTGEEVLGGHVH